MPFVPRGVRDVLGVAGSSPIQEANPMRQNPDERWDDIVGLAFVVVAAVIGGYILVRLGFS